MLTAAGGTPLDLSNANALHGQSDNLTAIALVDPAAGVLPDKCAVRWSFRYKAGIPSNGATLYRRAADQPNTLSILFNKPQQSPTWITVGSAKVRTIGSPTVIAAGSGLQVPKSFEVSFGFPVVSVEIVGSGDNTQTISVLAEHFPYVVDELRAAQPRNNSSIPAVRGDIIDYLVVTVSAPMTVQELLVIPLLEISGGSWEKVVDAPLLSSAEDFANGAVPSVPSSMTAIGQLTDAMQGLFDPSVIDSSGVVIPMGKRQIQSGPPADPTLPNIQLPILEFLRLAAILPATARMLGLLIDVTAAQADQQNAWDYLLVGHWGPRNVLRAGSRRVNLVGTPAATIAIVDGLLFESMDNLDFTRDGLHLGQSAVWIHFTAPGFGTRSAMVVELELATIGEDRVQVTAFNGYRMVDWAAGSRLRLTVCADSIDAICIVGNDALIRMIVWDPKDPALLGASTANIGDIYYWMFSARDHPVPEAPTGLVVGQLEGLWNRPPGGLWSSPPTYRKNDPKTLTVGLRWNPTPPLADVMMFYGAAYQVLRGANQQAARVIAGETTPLVVPPPPQAPDNVFPGSLPPNAGPWYFLDEVRRTPATLLYGLKSVDLFGRASQPAFSNSITLARTSAPEAPTNVQAKLQNDGSILITWAWNGTDPYLKGFNVYYKCGSASMGLTYGKVRSLKAAGQRRLALTVEIDTSKFNASSLAKTVVKVGHDHYVVFAARAATLQLPHPGGGVPTQVPGMFLTLWRNPSTPKQTPSVNDTVAIFQTLVKAGQPVPPSNYDGHVQVTAASYGATTTTQGTSSAGQPVVSVNSPAGFAANQYITLNLGGTDQEAGVVASLGAGNSITLATNLASTHGPGESVIQFQATLTPGQGGVEWSPPDRNGISTISVGVSSYNDSNIESMICGPATAKQIPNASSLSAPPAPQPTIEQIVFTNPPDAYGNCTHEYTGNCLPNSYYHVYRALDTTLLAVDAGYRDANGNRSLKGILPYDPTVYNPDGSPINPSPLQAVDFQTVTGPLPDPSQLTVTNWNALANLYGNEAAFQRITALTPIPSSGPTTGNTISYTDEGLPAGSNSKYFYRLRVVTASGDQGQWPSVNPSPFGWASSPVQLWPTPPTRPTIVSVEVGGNLAYLRWNANPELYVTSYRVYRADQELTAQDFRSMQQVVEVPTTDPAIDPIVSASFTIQEGQRYWVCVVAVADFPAGTLLQQDKTIVSAASDPVSFVPQTLTAPTAPDPKTFTIQLSGKQVQLTFIPADPNHTTNYMLLRQSGASGAQVAVSVWSQPQGSSKKVTLVDPSPLGSEVQYVIACKNESQRRSYSLPATYPRPAGGG